MKLLFVFSLFLFHTEFIILGKITFSGYLSVFFYPQLEHLLLLQVLQEEDDLLVPLTAKEENILSIFLLLHLGQTLLSSSLTTLTNKSNLALHFLHSNVKIGIFPLLHNPEFI